MLHLRFRGSGESVRGSFVRKYKRAYQLQAFYLGGGANIQCSQNISYLDFESRRRLGRVESTSRGAEGIRLKEGGRERKGRFPSTPPPPPPRFCKSEMAAAQYPRFR